MILEANRPVENEPAPRASARSRLIFPVLIVTTLVVGAVDVVTDLQRERTNKQFEVSAWSRVEDPSAAGAPLVAASWVNPEGHTPMSHVSSVVALPDGSLAATWYGGEREGAADVAIYLSRRRAGPGSSWSAPEVLVTPESVERDFSRNIRKLGNAVMFPDQDGHLWLVYVSVSVGGWSGGLLNVKRSTDGGRTWSEAQRLSVGPFLNFSTLVRSKPVFTDDGWIALPVYHEFVHKHPEMLWLKKGTEELVDYYQLRSPVGGSGLLQPSVVALDRQNAVMLLRDSNATRKVHRSISSDGGWTWTEPQALELANPDSGLDVVRLADGRLLMVYNEGSEGRSRLRLAVSADSGITWQPSRYIENQSSGEYSYPSLAIDQDGIVHLTYTWRRERIRHLRFHSSWIDGSDLPSKAVES